MPSPIGVARFPIGYIVIFQGAKYYPITLIYYLLLAPFFILYIYYIRILKKKQILKCRRITSRQKYQALYLLLHSINKW